MQYNIQGNDERHGDIDTGDRLVRIGFPLR